MNKLLFLSGLMLSTIFMASSASAWVYRNQTDLVEEKTIPFQLKKGGSTNEGIVTYVFSVNVLATQTGSAAKGFKLRDDRQCSISVSSVVNREVCFTTILGEQSCRNKYTKPLPGTTFYKPRKGNLLDYDPCGDYHAKMERMKRTAIQKLTDQIENIVKKDLNVLKADWTGTGVTVDYSN